MIDFTKQVADDQRKWKVLLITAIGGSIIGSVLLVGCQVIKPKVTAPPPMPPPVKVESKQFKAMRQNFPMEIVAVTVEAEAALPTQPKVWTISWVPRGVAYDKWTVDHWNGPHYRYVIEKKTNLAGPWQLVGYETQNTYIKVTNDFKNVSFRVGINEF